MWKDLPLKESEICFCNGQQEQHCAAKHMGRVRLSLSNGYTELCHKVTFCTGVKMLLCAIAEYMHDGIGFLYSLYQTHRLGQVIGG